jgi:tryptophanyl-tRNA synthetase
MRQQRPILLTCAQPTGKLHIGNYLGAIKNWVTLLNEYECFFGIVDMHAITVPYSPAHLSEHTLECLAQYIACGLDPEKCHIFLQSHVTGHTELAWILSCLTPIGQLQRMTQFKDKCAKEKQSVVGSGLLYYPILMAADILLYNADIVPVGNDQKQHLELARDIAEKFNRIYSPTFKVPKPYISSVGARIMSLQNPACKMSKSDTNDNGSLNLSDPPEILRKKIMSAVTDADKEIYACKSKPGITNLLNIMSASTGQPLSELEKVFKGKGYAQFKQAVADSVTSLLLPIQNKQTAFLANKPYLHSVLKKGAQAAQEKADEIRSTVYKKVGFVV